MEYGKEENKGMAEGMVKKSTVCQPFHPERCHVAIEPVSHFILVETYPCGRMEGLDILYYEEGNRVGAYRGCLVSEYCCDRRSIYSNYIENLILAGGKNIYL
jgi:hypothetical protein